ncbi:MAG: NADP-dependent oxidoreductase [Pseudomonadota bacterium]
MNRRFLLVRRPHAMPVPDDFALVETAMPVLPPGGLIVRNHYASLDPAQRGWMDDAPSYMPPIPLGDAVRAATLGVVHASDNPAFAPGDWVRGAHALEDYSAVPAGSFTRSIDIDAVDRPTLYLSALGGNAMTAYFGLLDIAKPQPGETLLVTGAAGGVGSIVGQIAKIAGCRTIGIAGGAEKCDRLLRDFGFDAAIDYKGKAVAELAEEIGEVAPRGLDMLFENVGGTVMDAALLNLAQGARVVLCGLISEYNAPERIGIRNLWQVLVQRATIHGMIVADYIPRFAEATDDIRRWLAEGKLHVEEDVQDGLETAYPAFMRLFSGANRGKQILRIA